MSEKAEGVVAGSPIFEIRTVKCRVRKNKGLTVVEAHRGNTDQKRLLIHKAGVTRKRLMFIAQAMRELVKDEKFVSLLMTEKLDTVPRRLTVWMKRNEVLDGEKIEAPANGEGVSAQAGKNQKSPARRCLPRSGRLA